MMMKVIVSLPHRGRIFFKDSSDTVITSAFAYFGPLTSEYQGLEVTPTNIKNTWLFILPGFTQRRLATKLVQQGHYVWIDGTMNFQITGLKDWGSHTEIVGLQQGSLEAFALSTAAGLVSEWAFVDSSNLVTDSQGRNDLTNENTVAFDTDKPDEIPFSVGSALFVASSSERLEISDASQEGLDIVGNITIAFRFKLTALVTTNNYVFVSKYGTAAGILVYTDTNDKVKFVLSSDGASATEATGGSVLLADVWYSVACVYNGTDMRIYLNGSLDTNGSNNPKSYSLGIVNNSDKFCLGCMGDNTQFLDGRLAHVFVFNQAKSAADILEWHNADVWP
jgi:hypothetical protein